MAEMLLMQKRDANSNFCKYIRRTYESWVTSEDRPLMSPKLFKNNVFPLLDKGEKVCFFLIDNFRLDQWKAIQPMLAEHFNVSEDLYTTILPTSTQYARNAIFAGLMPVDIATMYPQYWVDEDEDEGLNVHEQELVQTYTKIYDSTGCEKYLARLGKTRDIPLQVVVLNFIDMLSHARTESKMIRELASNDAAYRSLSESWFRHSGVLDIFARLAEFGYKVVLTTDHGTIRVENPIKVVGDKNTNTNLRSKQVYEIKNPKRFGLPAPNIASAYIFATNEDFFSYPNNYNYYVQYYNGTFQHGGISLEEMIVPLITLTPKEG